jgi:hypothetical protein
MDPDDLTLRDLHQLLAVADVFALAERDPATYYQDGQPTCLARIYLDRHRREIARAAGALDHPAIPTLRVWLRRRNLELARGTVRVIVDEAAGRRRVGEERAWQTTLAEAGRLLGADLEPEPAVIVHLDKRQYQVGAALPVVVTEAEDDVLQAFVDRPAYDEKGLIAAAGNDRAPRILRELTTRYGGTLGPAIRCPGGRDQGGYAVRIRDESGGGG